MQCAPPQTYHHLPEVVYLELLFTKEHYLCHFLKDLETLMKITKIHFEATATTKKGISYISIRSYSITCHAWMTSVLWQQEQIHIWSFMAIGCNNLTDPNSILYPFLICRCNNRVIWLNTEALSILSLLESKCDHHQTDPKRHFTSVTCFSPVSTVRYL